MTLLEKQQLFARLLPDLIIEAQYQGFNVTLGEVLRSPEQAAWNAQHGKGSVNSLHCKSLAVDLHLFKAGKYLKKSEDYKELGEWWESQSDEEEGYKCCWGGRFSEPDGNHFSIEHEGIK